MCSEIFTLEIPYVTINEVFIEIEDLFDIEYIYVTTVKPQLSEPTGRHTIGSDKWGVR